MREGKKENKSFRAEDNDLSKYIAVLLGQFLPSYQNLEISKNSPCTKIYDNTLLNRSDLNIQYFSKIKKILTSSLHTFETTFDTTIH